jgi:hypothetical protein
MNHNLFDPSGKVAFVTAGSTGPGLGLRQGNRLII